MLGSGTLLPDDERHSAAFHLAVGSTRLLLDCGTGTVHGFARHGIAWQALDAIALTHFHTDHVGDLAALLAALKFVRREQPLTLIGPPGLVDFLHRLAGAFGSWVVTPGFPLRTVELGPGESHPLGEGLPMVTAYPTLHTASSIACRVGDLVGYTGDTGPREELGAALAGCAVLIAECALRHPGEYPGHLSAVDVASLAGAVEPDLVLLTHVYPPRTPDEAALAVRDLHPGPVEAAHDGLRVVIGGRAVDPPTGLP